jgi:aspartyl protease family protein
MFRSIFTLVLVLAVIGVAAGRFLSERIPNDAAQPNVNLASAPVSTSFGQRSQAYGQISIAPDRAGNYATDVEIDGQLIRMIVDTGATYVSLTNEDASAIGLRPAPVDYRYRTMTANGVGVAAKVRIGTLRLGTWNFIMSMPLSCRRARWERAFSA